MKNIINIFRLLYVLFLCLAFLYKGYSQQQNERGGRLKGDTTVAKGITYAIIIGISNYKNVSALQYADKDAQAFENYLLSDAGGKILQENIETFLNANATRPNIGDAISILARKAKPGDRIYFFFAGHGDMEDLTQIENGLLLLYNSPNGNYFGMNDDVLEILNLKRYLSPLAQKGIEMIFIIDACHSGNLKGGVEGMQQTAAAMSAAWGKEYKILSCQPNQLSLESAEWGGGRGLFSLELEEGMKGMADQNNDGTVSMFELQSYLQANVSKYSDFKQIPLITGDLSKPFVKVNKEVLVALKKEKEENYPLIAKVNTKGNEEKYLDSLDEKGKKAYSSFLKNIESKKYIYPKDTNALADYRMLSVRFPNNPIILVMRRNLAAVLNERFNNIAEPLLKGKTSYSSREECKSAAEELDSCLHILGEQHYMYPNIKARKLFMDAMAMTWALHESEFSLGWRPTLEKSVSLLEESEKLEPNASYTQIILGEQYLFLYDYEKAFAKFQKYIELHPKDYYAKYSLATVYLKMKQFDKSEAILKELINEYPTYAQQYALLSQIYYDQNNNPCRKNSLWYPLRGPAIAEPSFWIP